jgi:predicted deacylase
VSKPIFGRTFNTGERSEFRVKVAEHNDGSDVTIPVAVLRGARDGPTVAIIGGVHGDEYSGWAVLRALLPTIDPAMLAGTIIALPIANPFAMYAESPVNTLDYEYMNLNRIWPGHARGYLSQQMAHVVFDGGLAPADHIIDIHDGGRDLLARYLIIAGTPEVRARVHAKALQMARWFGQGYPIRDMELGEAEIKMGRRGALYEAAGAAGIPLLMPELGGGGRVDPVLVSQGTAGTRNVLLGLQMIAGTPQGADLPQAHVRVSDWLQPTRGGFSMSQVELGAVVEAGQVLGIVMDPLGRVVETLRAPYRSVLLDVRHVTAVHPGDLMYHCGRLD